MSAEMTKVRGPVAVPERFLDAGGVEQAKGDVQRLAEASVGVVVDFAGVHDGADPKLPVRAVGV